MYKKIFLILSLPILLGTSCMKSNESDNQCPYVDQNVVAPQSEVDALQAWLAVKGIVATKHPNGFFYIINEPGSGPQATVCSEVTVKYVGTLENGTEFDNSNTNYPNGIPFSLGRLILGWQKGIPLIKPGGSISLYIPPYLGYGSNPDPRSGIPPNANLIFSIQLVNVQN